MKHTIMLCGFAALTAQVAWAQAPQYSHQQTKEQMLKAQQMMNDPATQQQMQQAMEQMKAHGVDTSQMGGMQGMQGQAMNAAMQMNDCMNEKVGEENINRMMQESQEMGKKLEALCKAGKRAEADKLQKDYALSMTTKKEYTGMRECSEKYAMQYQNMQPDPSMMAMHKNMDVMKEQKDRHVCDSSVATSQKLVPGAGSHQ